MRTHIWKPVIHKNTWCWGKTHTIVIRNGHGFVNVSIENDNPQIALIHGVSVTEDYRKLGTGRTLMMEAEAEAAEMGASRVCLATEPGSWMESWYRRLGYEFNSYDENNLIVLVKNLEQFDK